MMTLEAFWIARITERAADMTDDELRREHDAACAEIEDAIKGRRAASESAMRRMGVFQAERGRRAAMLSTTAPRASAGPVLVHYETSIGDGPGALPLRLSAPVLCF